MNNQRFFVYIAVTMMLTSCDFLFGNKQDDTIDDILLQGAIDPNLIPSKVGYVPILPIWKNFNNPVDVYVGYDEMVYVCDDNGLHILDQKGDEQRLIALQGATDVVQDRQLNTFVLGRIVKNIDGQNYNLAAVYKIANASGAGNPTFVDTLVHPFCDISRNSTNFRQSNDVQVQFTGIGTLHNNQLYLARTGPTNTQGAVARPDRCILFFDDKLRNTGSAVSLNSVSSSLKSVLDISALTTFAAPPQLVFGINTSEDFLMLQAAPQAEYKALWIRQTYSPDAGYDYAENINMLNYDTTRATRFLYQSYRFAQPADVCIAPDETGYIFVVDAQKDSLYQFTNKGFEGVNPPANSGIKKQIITSFGGRGAGAFEFNQPSGVAYFKRIVYVADKGNNRIIRYKLSTDLER